MNAIMLESPYYLGKCGEYLINLEIFVHLPVIIMNKPTKERVMKKNYLFKLRLRRILSKIS